jgi:molybdenum cofactor biosynthesis enzyme MoaA
MAHSFCRRLTNAYRFNHIEGKLHYQPCCWVPFNIPITNKNSLESAQHKIIDLVEKNSDRTCYECLQREKTNFRLSGRIAALEYIPEDAEPGEAYQLEFQIDTTCNAACAMCGPHLSSLWQKQNNVTVLKDSIIQQMHTQVFSMIEVDKVSMIRFLGGEPLLTNSHFDIIKSIPDPSTVTIAYVTNGSIYPDDEVLKLWSKFKKVMIAVSIDGIDDQFSYIRWPLKWSWVSSNFVKLALALPNISMSINYTVNPMNASYIVDFEEWLDSTQTEFNIKVKKTFSACFGDWSIERAPQSLRSELIEQCSSDHPLIGILKSFSEELEYNTLVNNMNNLDQLRNLNWRQTFSKVAHHFK